MTKVNLGTGQIGGYAEIQERSRSAKIDRWCNG